MKDKKQKDELRIEALLGYANSIIATLREPFLVLDKNLRVISANQAFYTTFKVTEKDIIGQLLPDLGNRQWNIPKLLQLLKEIISEKKVVKDYEVEHKFEQIGERAMVLNACQLRVPKKIAGIIAVISLFHGMFAPSKTKRNIISKQTSTPQKLTVTTEKGAVYLTRDAKKTAYSSWLRDPFSESSAAGKPTLNGIMWDKENPAAIINNNIVKIGDKVSGNTVVDIKQDKVILNDGTEDFELKLGQ